MNEEGMSEPVNTEAITTQAQLDRWRAYVAQTVRDVREARMMIARGQATAADQLLGGVLESSLIVGVAMDDAGANRPAGMRPYPKGEELLRAEREANE